MSANPIAILNTGLVTAVGLSAPESCAAIRAGISNPTETGFIDSSGDRIMAHQVVLEQPWRGLTKLAKMSALVVDEAMKGIPKADWGRLPLLLCVGEAERPGRTEGLDDRLFQMIQDELAVRFAPQSAIVTQGRVGVAVALAQARTLIVNSTIPRVLIAATDSLLTLPTLRHYQRQDRLLTRQNSNGFMPGEGAGALLVGAADGSYDQLICTGVGFGRESAPIDSGEPLRGEGLSQAIRDVLRESGCEMHEMDFRITDVSGEQYYFKEAALALGRTLRRRKATFDIWHAAECIGETGAAAGVALIALAHAASTKSYALGTNILAHMSNDAGQRAALALHCRRAT